MTKDTDIRFAQARGIVAKERERVMAERTKGWSADPESACLLKYFNAEADALLALWTNLSPDDTEAVDAIVGGLIDPERESDPVLEARRRRYNKAEKYLSARGLINGEYAKVSVKRMLEKEKETPCPALVAYLDAKARALSVLEDAFLGGTGAAAIEAVMGECIAPLPSKKRRHG
ncbi:MAG: hypothetical protein LBU76_03450 [Azoarcus sp.]|nr:hypothetical protein [Azoarcus sp.]